MSGPGSIEDRVGDLEARVSELEDEEEKPMGPMTHEEKLIYAAAFAAAAITDRDPLFAANTALKKYRKVLQIVLTNEPQTEEGRALLAFAGVVR